MLEVHLFVIYNGVDKLFLSFFFLHKHNFKTNIKLQ